MPDEITRAEYEARQAEIRQQVLGIETSLRTDLKGLENKIDNLSTTINSVAAYNKSAFWKLIASSLITFLVGSGMGTFLTLYLHH